MTLTELLPALGSLDHKEKLQAVQFLVAELANEDQVAQANAFDTKKSPATEDSRRLASMSAFVVGEVDRLFGIEPLQDHRLTIDVHEGGEATLEAL